MILFLCKKSFETISGFDINVIPMLIISTGGIRNIRSVMTNLSSIIGVCRISLNSIVAVIAVIRYFKMSSDPVWSILFFPIKVVEFSCASIDILSSQPTRTSKNKKWILDSELP